MLENTMVSGINTPLCVLSHVQLFVTPWIVALQAPLSMAFSRQEYQCSPFQLLSRVWLFSTPWTAAGQASLSIINSWSLLKLMSIVSDVIQPSHPVIPFPSHLQSFPASGSFPMSWFFTSGGQCIRVSASVLVLPMNIQDWFPLGLIGWISLQSKELSRVFSNTTVQKHQHHSSKAIILCLP